MIPAFTVKIPVESPSSADDGVDEGISLDRELIRNPRATFIIESTGDSMINAFIPPGAKLLVDRSLTPGNGDIVLAELDGEFMVKFLKKNDFRCWLIPANRKYREIEISGEQTLKVWGVVTTIITDTRIVRGAMI